MVKSKPLRPGLAKIASGLSRGLHRDDPFGVIKTPATSASPIVMPTKSDFDLLKGADDDREGMFESPFESVIMDSAEAERMAMLSSLLRKSVTTDESTIWTGGRDPGKSVFSGIDWSKVPRTDHSADVTSYTSTFLPTYTKAADIKLPDGFELRTERDWEDYEFVHILVDCRHGLSEQFAKRGVDRFKTEDALRDWLYKQVEQRMKSHPARSEPVKTEPTPWVDLILADDAPEKDTPPKPEKAATDAPSADAGDLVGSW